MARSFLFIPLFAAVVSAAQLAVQSAHVSITSSEGSQLHTETLDIGGRVPSSALVLSPTDSLKLSFTVTGKDDGKGVQPHQAFLRFYDEETGEEGIQPNMARPPVSIPPTSTAPLSVSLILGSFVYDPLQVHLFDLALPESATPPQHPDESTFYPLPEIQHTFRPDPKSPPQFISAVFAAVVLSPWLALFPMILPFVTLLAAFEGLLLWYWVALRIGQVLAYGAVLGSLTTFAGNRALKALAKWRIEGGRK
ncbi:hypothetical protein EW145_g5366 [Phellinidium pouzarii]|uniref:Ribophorin II n=1 Tax=Phellinidium pouzarii TaxID=167371 RepID=A0A4S4L0A0_9AGAM|nr:hypothetical protein EW145_g5366 [Phellinidium pouzarii]